MFFSKKKGNKHGVNEDVLNQYGIKYVINLADELNDVLPKGFFCYKISHFKKYTPSELYDEIFEEFYNTLLSIPSSEKVFIHCKQGKSRSAAMVIGFIMRQFRVDYKKGLHWVKTKRPLVEPNQRFSKWLKKVNLNDFYARAKPVPITSSKEIGKLNCYTPL
jgi:protein-tyrosine phosphatase